MQEDRHIFCTTVLLVLNPFASQDSLEIFPSQVLLSAHTDVCERGRCWQSLQMVSQLAAKSASLPGLFLPHIPRSCPDLSQGCAWWCVFPGKHGRQGWNSKYMAGWLSETVTEISLRVRGENQVFLGCNSSCPKVHVYICSHEPCLLGSTDSEEQRL